MLHLLKQHGFTVKSMKNWPACSPNPPATENKKRIQESWAARILYQRASLSQKCNSWSPKLPDVYGLLLKDQRMIHSGKDVPVPAFLGACCWAIIFLNMVRFSHFKHLMCFAFAIVNRIWGCEISIQFTFIHIVPKNDLSCLKAICKSWHSANICI